MKDAPLAAALLGLLLLGASGARADEPTSGVSFSPPPVAVTVDADGTATVTLKNGNLYRGALIERIQGDHVTVKMATGEVKTFAWAELAPAQAAAPAPPPAPPPLPPAVAQVESPKVLVTLTGDEGVRLERVVTTETDAWGGGWNGGAWGGVAWGGAWGGRGGMSVIYGGVCQAPCNARVDSSYIYRVAGPGYVATHTFQVSGDAVRIDAHMGSMAQRVLGWVLFGAGAATAITGFLGGWICGSLPTNCAPAGWFIAGGVGLAATLGGLVMVLTSGSSVEVNGQPVGLRLAPHVALTPRGLVF